MPFTGRRTKGPCGVRVGSVWAAVFHARRCVTPAVYSGTRRCRPATSRGTGEATSGGTCRYRSALACTACTAGRIVRCACNEPDESATPSEGCARRQSSEVCHSAVHHMRSFRTRFQLSCISKKNLSYTPTPKLASTPPRPRPAIASKRSAERTAHERAARAAHAPRPAARGTVPEKNGLVNGFGIVRCRLGTVLVTSPLTYSCTLHATP